MDSNRKKHVQIDNNPADMCLFKLNNGNTITMCEICSKLTKKTPEQCQSLSIPS